MGPPKQVVCVGRGCVRVLHQQQALVRWSKANNQTLSNFLPRKQYGCASTNKPPKHKGGLLGWGGGACTNYNSTGFVGNSCSLMEQLVVGGKGEGVRRVAIMLGSTGQGGECGQNVGRKHHKQANSQQT